jgi:hypothetical protein
MSLQAMIDSAAASQMFHMEHCFECWVAGDVAGIRIAWLGARRCEHVIRIARAMMP